jgi:hypothetical protein
MDQQQLPIQTNNEAYGKIGGKQWGGLQATAVSILILFISGLIPVFGFVLLFLSIVPQVILLRKKEYSSLIFSWISVLLFVFLLRGWRFGLNYVFLFIPYALCFNTLIGRNIKPLRAVVLSAMYWCVLFMVWIGGVYFIFKVNFFEEIFRLSRIAGATSMGKYYDFGLNSGQMSLLNGSFSSMIEFFLSSAVGWIIIVSVIGSWIVYHVLSKHAYAGRLAAIKLFRLPENYIWFLMAAIVLYIAGSKFYVNNTLTLIGSNMGIVLLGGYLLSGLGLVLYFMTNWGFSALILERKRVEAEKYKGIKIKK